MNWIINKLLLGYLKGFLDKLPGNGAKTVLGIVILVLGEVIKALPQYSGVLSPVFDFIRQLPADPVTDIGIVTLVTGVVHKVLKWAGAKS